MAGIFKVLMLCLGFVLFSESVFASGEVLAEEELAYATRSVTGGVNVAALLRGLFGLIVLLVIAVFLSKDRKNINWRLVGAGLLLQVVVALGVLYIPAVESFFVVLGKVFVKIMDFSKAGASFLFGDLANSRKFGHIFIFQVLPALVFFSALTSLLYYLRVIQTLVTGVAWCLKKLFGISGAEGLTVSGSVFLGLIEAPLLVKRYLPTMNRSELFLIMSSGMATVAGGVMAAYIGMLGGDNPAARLQFAKYLISASVMAAPAVIAVAKIIVPQTETVADCLVADEDNGGKKNLLESIVGGAFEGIKVAVSVGALLLVFVAMVAMVNYLLGGLIGEYSGLNKIISQWTDGRYTELNFQLVLGFLFMPVSWIMGVCNQDLLTVGGLLGTKLVLNEFVAYADLTALKNAGVFFQEKSIVISTYLLCGFANIGSIGMLIGGLGALVPSRRGQIVEYGFLSMVCGALVSCMSATIMGAIIG